MQKKEIENKLNAQSYIDPEMIKATFHFWYNDHDHIRSPFPDYIREQLQDNATANFLEWCSKISDKAKKEINDEILVEKFEEIVFETALPLVLTEDEKLTIRYPFLLRIGDTINVKDAPLTDKADSKVTDRWYEKRGDSAFMKVKLQTKAGEKWETEFELPE